MYIYLNANSYAHLSISIRYAPISHTQKPKP